MVANAKPEFSGKKNFGSMLLLLASAIWGSGFVAQRAAMSFLGPFTFNALRFALASIVLVLYLKSRGELRNPRKWEIRSGTLVGLLLFGGATFQQIGMTTTSAGKAGFITGLYLLFTPLLLYIGWGHRTSIRVWLGALIATIGLYFMSVHETLSFSVGDAWLIACALAFSLHLIFVERYVSCSNPIELAVMQNVVCALASAAMALYLEPGSWLQTGHALVPLLYSGVISIGIAYTLQLVGQQHVPSALAALILSAEALFALFFGWLLLSEVMSAWQLCGALLIFIGILSPQSVRLPLRLHN